MSDLDLIHLVKNHPNLYDKNRPDFRDKYKRNKSWQYITARIGNGYTVDECQLRWKNLREAYGKRIRRSKENTSSSRLEDWEYSGAFQFLLPHIKHRRSLERHFGSHDSLRNTRSYICDDSKQDNTVNNDQRSVVKVHSLHSDNATTAHNDSDANSFDRTEHNIVNALCTLEETLMKELPADNSDMEFGRYIALHLKHVSKSKKNRLKLEIVQLLEQYM